MHTHQIEERNFLQRLRCDFTAPNLDITSFYQFKETIHSKKQPIQRNNRFKETTHLKKTINSKRTFNSKPIQSQFKAKMMR